MGIRQYVGARYVPTFANPIQWDNQRIYEPLTMVTYLNNTYTSKKPVPQGVDINNTEYWALSGNYNAQVEQYRQEVEALKNSIVFKSVIDYGADNTGNTDSTNAVQRALNANANILFPSGSYIVNNINIGNNHIILLDNAKIITNSKGFIGGNNKNITITGTGEFNNNGGERFIQLTSAENIKVNGNIAVTGFSNVATLEFYECTNVEVSGLKTSDSTIFLGVGSSNVKIHNITANYISNPGYCISVTRVDDNPYKNIEVYSCVIDGGNVLSLAAINISIDVAGGGTFNPTSNNFNRNTNIFVHDNAVSNCAGQCDGIDILFARDIFLNNNTVKNCLEGIAILSDNVTMTNCNIQSCRGVGLAIGDPSLGSGGVNYSAITISNSIIANNGTGAGVEYKQPKANIGFIQQDGGFVASVYITNALIFGSDTGIYSNSNTGGSNIVITNSFIYGASKVVDIADLSQFYFSGVPTYNRRGAITPPNISTENVTNTNGVDVDIHIVNGGSNAIQVYVNDVALFSVPAGGTVGYRLYANANTKLSSIDGCSWSWQVV